MMTSKQSAILYSLLFYCLLPLVMARLLWRGIKQPAYCQRCLERFGFFKFEKTQKKSIWVHTVSVGEVLAAKKVIRFLVDQYPQYCIVVTTMTPTGSDQVRSLFGDQVFHVYAPYDLPGSVKRFLSRIQPTLFLIMETEIWPNTIKHCHQLNIPMVLMNARLSEKSFSRYQTFPNFTRHILCKISHIAAQTEADAKRFQALGAHSFTVTGSIKADIDIDESLKTQAQQIRHHWNNHHQRPILLAASTHRGEDELILQAFKTIKQTLADTLLVLVPRHPERFKEVESLCIKKHYTVIKKSTSVLPREDTDIILGDTMGQLLLLCGVSDVVIMGGTFIEHGGHNFLEPAIWGVPILSGRSVYNFSAIAEGLNKVGALAYVDNAETLGEKALTLLQDNTLRSECGTAAQQYAHQLQGALGRLLTVIEEYLSGTKSP